MHADSKKHDTPTDPSGGLVSGYFLTFNGDIISDSGKIIAEKGQKVEIEKVLKTPGFWGKISGQWHNEKIYGVKLKGYRGEWLLSAFVETSNL